MDRTTHAKRPAQASLSDMDKHWIYAGRSYVLIQHESEYFHFIAQKVFCYGIVTFALLHIAIKSRFVHKKSGEPSVKKITS